MRVGLDHRSMLHANAAMLIYKIFRPAEWDSFQAAGKTDGAPVDLADGYIHFSTAEQVHETLGKHFANDGDLVLLACDADAMTADLRWEAARAGALFPHLYRALHMSDVVWSRPITRGSGGYNTGPLE